MKPVVHFSPHGGCAEQVVACLKGARQFVRFMAYSFTSVPIADAMIAAHRRGVDVKGIVDARMANERQGQAHRVAAAGLEVVADASHPIFHDKVCLCDSEVVITGSWNFTEQATQNAENLLTLHDPALAAAYLADWERHRVHSIALPAPTVGAAPWPPVSVELSEQGYGFQVAIGGVRIGPALTRDAVALVARWLDGGALDDLAGVLGAGDAEGSDEP